MAGRDAVAASGPTRSAGSSAPSATSPVRRRSARSEIDHRDRRVRSTERRSIVRLTLAPRRRAHRRDRRRCSRSRRPARPASSSLAAAVSPLLLIASPVAVVAGCRRLCPRPSSGDRGSARARVPPRRRRAGRQSTGARRAVGTRPRRPPRLPQPAARTAGCRRPALCRATGAHVGPRATQAQDSATTSSRRAGTLLCQGVPAIQSRSRARREVVRATLRCGAARRRSARRGRGRSAARCGRRASRR